MNDIVISADNLSKKYMLGTAQQRYNTLRDLIADSVRGINFRLKNKGGSDQVIWALKDVSFEVKRGEVVGIIGRNGAGKTTLLKILSRITRPTAGRAVIRGRVGSLLEVGTGFHSELSGRENIYLNGAILGMYRTEIDDKFDEIVDFSGIEQFIDTPVKRYSSGMYVRLAFAVAAHLDPEVLLVDEVLAVGDYEFQQKCLGKMREVSEGGRTVLFVSHNLGSISNLCKRSMLIADGKKIKDGETKNIIDAYLSMGAEKSCEIIWDDNEAAPGNRNVRLKALRIKSGDQIKSDVHINQEIIIEIEYENFKDGAYFISSMHLRDNTSSYVLASADRPSSNLMADPWSTKPRPQGIFRTTCIIPANFLNSGKYSLDIGIANSRNEYEFNIENIISFNVIETGEMKKEYSGSWVGVVRPKLAWETDFLTTD